MNYGTYLQLANKYLQIASNLVPIHTSKNPICYKTFKYSTSNLSLY